MFNDNILVLIFGYINCQMLFAESCHNGELETSKFLFKYGKVNIHVSHDTIFNHCCYLGELQIAEWLIGLDGEINIYDEFYMSAYCCRNNLKTVKWLFKQGCDIYSVLKHAGNLKIYKNPKFVEMILESEIKLELIRIPELRERVRDRISEGIHILFRDLINIITSYL